MIARPGSPIFCWLVLLCALLVVASACAERNGRSFLSNSPVPAAGRAHDSRDREVFTGQESTPATAASAGKAASGGAANERSRTTAEQFRRSRPDQQEAPVTDQKLRNILPDQNAPPAARDLGEGAGGEKLGNPQRDQDLTRDEAPERRGENRFVHVGSPGGDASTFAADVDTASYNVVRASLEQRRLPAPSEVRVEELINRFRYDYPTPTADDQHPFRISTEVVACPWHAGHQVVRIGIAGETLTRRQRPPANLVFLIDVSGSMNEENRLPLLKRSLALLVDQLDARDRVAIVTYAGAAGVAMQPTAGDEHRAIKRVIDRLGAGGSTHGSDGIREAYRLAREQYSPHAASRVILATDGDFNVGITDPDELVKLIRREAESGIYLTALGFGMGGSCDARLQQLADHGNGFHAFIDREDEARRLFVERLPSSLVTIAQDVKVQVFFNPTTVAAWRLIGYEKRHLQRQDFNDDRVDAGELGAGHTMTALYEIVPTAGQHGERVDPNPFIADEQTAEPAAPAGDASALLRVRLRYQPPGGGASRLMEHDVAATTVRRQIPRDTAFALAVAGFSMLLAGSSERGSCTWDLVASLAEAGRGYDDHARGELLDLITIARRLMPRAER